LKNLIQSMGFLRVMLHALAFLLILILPFSEPSWNPQGSALLLGAVVPAFAPIVAIIIMMDVMMCKVSQSDSQDDQIKLSYRNIVRANLVTAFLLFAFWLASFREALL